MAAPAVGVTRAEATWLAHQRLDRRAGTETAPIDKRTHEIAVLRRLKFAAQSERFNAETRASWA